ncbi:MAG TPA: hypothetical protein VNQ90_08655 [Chthoniobacteraceae bacterium]|nr:hypothetical protein [Chthoniobacteraceae bacterium]
MFSPLKHRILLLLLVVAAGFLLRGELPAQEPAWDVPDVTLDDGGRGPEPAMLEIEPTPLTTLIDFSLYRHPAARGVERRGLPIWLESVQVDEAIVPGQTTFRLRLRSLGTLNERLLLRLFFVDQADARPVVSGWSETGECRFVSRELGAGLGLAASESLQLETRGVDYLEITVPGDGSTLRQALLATLRPVEVQAALDFDAPEPVVDPFGASVSSRVYDPQALPAARDSFLYGRVRAMLEPGTLRLGAEEGRTVDFGFDLVARPLLAMMTLEVLSPDPAAPLLAWANGEPVGAIAMELPDLADPGYQGAVKGSGEMRFHYAGWVRSRVMIPGHLLRTGKNVVTFQLPSGVDAVAIRRVELQLKNHWQQLDYTVTP